MNSRKESSDNIQENSYQYQQQQQYQNFQEDTLRNLSVEQQQPQQQQYQKQQQQKQQNQSSLDQLNLNLNRNQNQNQNLNRNQSQGAGNQRQIKPWNLGQNGTQTGQAQSQGGAHYYNTQDLKPYFKSDYRNDELDLNKDQRGLQLPTDYSQNFNQNQNQNQNQSQNNQLQLQQDLHRKPYQNFSYQQNQSQNQQDTSFTQNINKPYTYSQVPKTSIHDKPGTRPGQNLIQDFKSGGSKQQFEQNHQRIEQDNGSMFNPQEKYQIFTNPYQELELTQKKEFLQQNFDENQFDNRKYTVLMIAEKPSIARNIAEALSGKSGFNTRKGNCKFCNVYEYYGTMFGKKAFFKVTSVIGHIYTTDFPVGYQDWRKIDPLDLFDAPTMKKETNPDSNIIGHLQKESLGSSYVVLWLDNDREGENICFEALNICKPNLIKENFMQIYRAKFSSITEQDIRIAFKNLNCGPNINESISVDARQIIDLKIGVAFSRFQTRYLVRKYQELNQKKVTFGPCQTPTLAFCVARDDEIAQFRSQNFYRPIPRATVYNNQQITLEWSKDRTFDQQEAEQVKSEMDQIGQVQVINCENQQSTRQKPEGLNTVVMLKLASQQIGMGPQQTMHFAEKLYLGGFTTYPRTESTRYSGNFDHQGVLQAIAANKGNQQIAQYAQKLLNFGTSQPKHGKDVGDHPPITPTSKTPTFLQKQEQILYELICRQYMATLSPDAKFQKKKITFMGQQSKFFLKGTACENKGFIEIMPWIKIHENEIPNFQQGDILRLDKTDLHIGKTQPPDHISESELITLMEKNGIGTDASMATHINNICERDYVQVVGQSRRLVPTQLGKSLFHGYQSIDTELVAPELRSSIERSVDLIAKGEVKYEEVLKNVLNLFRSKYIYFVSNIGKFDSFFNVTFSSIDQAIALASGFSKCGRCKKEAKLLQKVNKLYCDQCKFMYGLPRALNYEAAVDCFCPVDGYQLILCLINKNGNQKKISICPLCYQKSPAIEEIQFNRFDRVSCNACSNRNCHFSMGYNEIAKCRHCNSGGRLVLDWPQNGKYTMTCNVCQYQYQLCHNGQVYRSKTTCNFCRSHIVKVELNEPERGYNDMVFEGCVFCDPTFCRVMLQFPPQAEDAQEKKGNFLQSNQVEEGKENKPGGNQKEKGKRGPKPGPRKPYTKKGGNQNNNNAGGSGRKMGTQRGKNAGTERYSNSKNSKRKQVYGGGNNNNRQTPQKGRQNNKQGFQYSNNNLQDPMAILRKPIQKH